MTEPPDDPVEALFHQAAALPPGERAALLDAACRGDPGLRAEVESLLDCDERTPSSGSWLESPLVRRSRSTPAFGPPAEPGEVGTLGPYRVVKELGRGGMGAVYAAADARLGRRLALKVMLPHYAADSAAKERFLREARAAAQISHDNVVTVYEADERGGVPYIAMQLLEGYSLHEYLKQKGPLPLPQVLRIAGEAAAGLAAAHKIGLVHRDVKPGNLWLEAPQGRVKVLDFGLAKPLDAEVELTQSGAVVGTPAYMSPEQARGEKLDHRTDLFSLGAVLYRLISGRLPFDGPTTMAVLTALATEEPPPLRQLSQAVPAPLAELIHQMLAKKPAGRPPSAAVVVERLRAIAEGNPLPAPALKKSAGSWRRIAIGFAALLAVLVAGVIIIIKNKDGTETKIEAPDGVPVTITGKEGKTVVEIGPGPKPMPAGGDADRRAAEWALSLGGAVQVNGQKRDLRVAAELPRDRFTLTTVNLDGTGVTDAGLEHLKGLEGLTKLLLYGAPVTDAGLVHLKGFTGLTELGLGGRTKVTDAGLVHLKGLKGLRILYLDGTGVTDAGLPRLKDLKGLTTLDLGATPVTEGGLAQLKDFAALTVLSLHDTPATDATLGQLKNLKALTSLNLDRTKVTDAGLKQLKSLKDLTMIYVKETKVTAKGLAEFHAAVPGCNIQHDGGVIEANK